MVSLAAASCPVGMTANDGNKENSENSVNGVEDVDGDISTAAALAGKLPVTLGGCAAGDTQRASFELAGICGKFGGFCVKVRTK